MAEKGRRNREERPMQRHDVDRRLFLGASAVTLLGAAGAARAQAPQAAKASDTAGAKPTARVVDFIAGFDLKHAPALAVERCSLPGARVAPRAGRRFRERPRCRLLRLSATASGARSGFAAPHRRRC